MITGWMIFGACALIAILTAESLGGKKQKKAKSEYTEEDLNRDIMERNNRMMEEARKKGLAA